MAIRVKHSATGAMAPLQYLGAKKTGERKREREDRQFELQQDQFEAKQQRFEDRQQFRRKQAELDRQFQEEQARLEHARSLQQQELANELQQQNLEFKEKLQRGTIDYKYSQEQKREWQEYERAKQEIQNSEEFSEEEKLQAIKQLQAKQLGIKPEPILKDPQDDPQTQFEQQTIRKGGSIYAKTEEGWEKLGDDHSFTTNEDLLSAREQAIEELRMEAGVGEGESVQLSPEKIQKRQNQILERDMREQQEGQVQQQESGRKGPFSHLSEVEIIDQSLEKSEHVKKLDPTYLSNIQNERIRAQIIHQYNKVVNQVEQAKEAAKKAPQGSMEEVRAIQAFEKLKKDADDFVWEIRNQIGK